jgi:hypothetical protein
MRSSKLNTMARNMVGDGKSPNLFFVCGATGDCALVSQSKELAMLVARSMAGGVVTVEDRLTGLVWWGGRVKYPCAS